MVSIEQLTSIRRADPAEWDALAGNEVFWRHGWVATFEESMKGSNRSRYFIARDASGIQAAAVCHVQESNESMAGIDRVLFGRLVSLSHALRLNVSPVLVCGARVGLASHVRVRADVSPCERKRTIEAIMHAMQETARSERRTLCFRNVRNGEVALDELLRDHGFIKAAEMPNTLMNVVWGTFEEYVRDLKQTHAATAKNIPHEFNRARRCGIVLRRLEHPGALTPRLHQLLCDHYVRLNGSEFPFDSSLIRNLCERLGDSIVLFTAFSGDLPIGITIGIRCGNAMYLPFIGMDKERGKNTFAYFHLAYNEPIRYAIETGVRSFYCGKLLYGLKVRRGFRQVPLYMYLYLQKPVRRALMRPIAACQIARVKSMVDTSSSRSSNTEKPAW